MTNQIEFLHNALRVELDLTQKYITSYSETRDRFADKAIKHIISNRGKMLRPIMLISSGRYSFINCKGDIKAEKLLIDDIAKAAAILELIQMSSLIHDDVLDQASERRNKYTLNKLKGNRFAVLIGDYLVAQSLKNCYEFILSSERQFGSEVLYSFLDGISKLVLGEVQQNNFNENLLNGNNDINKYFEIIANKTASLFSLSCFVGSTVGGNNSELAQTLKSFGHNLGMAYQIIDDLRDFSFSRSISGEEGFQDINFGIKTLPFIYACHYSENGSREKLSEFLKSTKKLSRNDKFEIIEILIKSGSIERTSFEVKEYINKSKAILNQLPENYYLSLLTDLVNYLSEICDKVVDDIYSVRICSGN